MSWHQDGKIHITWGPEGERLPPEEKERQAAELLAESQKRRDEHDKAIAALEGLPFVAVPVEQLADIYERMLRMSKLGQTAINEFATTPDAILTLHRKIFDQADIGAVHAGQWLPRELQNEVRARVKAEAKTA